MEGKSENIRVVNIIGRYLEHSRILVFGNGGEPLYFITSADWMVRNIEHRIETTIPIYDASIKNELQRILDIQLTQKPATRSKTKFISSEDVQDKTFEYISSLNTKEKSKTGKRNK